MLTLYRGATGAPPAGYAEVPQHAPRVDAPVETDDVEMHGSSHGPYASDGMFRLPAAQRQRLQGDVFRRCRVDSDLSSHVSTMEGSLSGRMASDAYAAGMAAKSLEQQSWQHTRYWRFICGVSSLSCATVAALIVYWGFAVGTSLQSTLMKVDTLHPTLLKDTISDAAELLRGAAMTSRAIGQLSESAKPALLNLTAASASMLANVARITGQPTIQIALGGTDG